MKKNVITLLLAIAMLATLFTLPVAAETVTPDEAVTADEAATADEASESALRFLTRYSTGYSSQDGGTAEIIAYNPDLKNAYLVNGNERTVDILKYDDEAKEVVLDKRIDVSEMIEGFTFGDVTCVAVDTNFKRVAVAVQEEDFKANGSVLLLDYEGNYVAHYEAGVQPDMITVSEDGTLIITADEGEPREGYIDEESDPKGSVTVVNLSDEANPVVTTIDFSAFDEQRDELLGKNVLIKKDLNPSTDFEPEYVVISPDRKNAYVSLQEANAIAVLDLETLEFTGIHSLGFKDHRFPGNEIDAVKDKKVEIKDEKLIGVCMPDAIALVQLDGVDYILTANEGDATEWGEDDNEYTNMTAVPIGEDAEVEVLDKEKVEGFPEVEEDVNFILGARSFSIYKVEENGLVMIYDSGADIEKLTAEKYPENFNASHKNNKIDSRSDAKGPEPEELKVYIEGENIYLFVALERISGVLAYELDAENDLAPSFLGYCNSRDFSVEYPEDDVDPALGDLGPEGLAIVPAEDSPTGNILVLVANEVSGTVSVLELAR